MTSFYRQAGFGSAEKDLAIAEALFSFHTVFHNHIYRSMTCTSKIIKELFEKKISCAATKSDAIVKRVFAPLALKDLKKDLDCSNYVTVFSDASNHKDLKLFPILVRYFNANTGVNVKILQFVSLPGETSELISESIFKILEEHGLKAKLVAYCADNTNTNFGGASRKGTKNVRKK